MILTSNYSPKLMAQLWGVFQKNRHWYFTVRLTVRVDYPPNPHPHLKVSILCSFFLSDSGRAEALRAWKMHVLSPSQWDVVSSPARWSFSFTLGPLRWSSIFLTSREHRNINIVQSCTSCLLPALHKVLPPYARAAQALYKFGGQENIISWLSCVRRKKNRKEYLELQEIDERFFLLQMWLRPELVQCNILPSRRFLD